GGVLRVDHRDGPGSGPLSLAPWHDAARPGASGARPKGGGIAARSGDRAAARGSLARPAGDDGTRASRLDVPVRPRLIGAVRRSSGSASAGIGRTGGAAPAVRQRVDPAAA